MNTFEHLGYFVEVFDVETSSFLGFLPQGQVDEKQYSKAGFDGRLTVDRNETFMLKTNLGRDKVIKVGKGQVLKTYQVLQIKCGQMVRSI